MISTQTDAIEAAILSAARESGATRADVVARLIDRTLINFDPNGPEVGAKRAVLRLQNRCPDLFLRARGLDLTHAQRNELKAADSIALVVASLQPFRHRLSPGVDLGRMAADMVDLAPMSPEDREATIDRRLTAPSHWLEKYGPPNANATQARAPIPRSKPLESARPQYLQEQEATGGDLLALDHHNPFIEAAKRISNYRM